MRAVTHAILRSQLPLPDGPLLELGCGGGQLLAEFSRQYPERSVLGVDLNSLALAYAQEHSIRDGTLLQADMQRLPFEEGTFGAIVALDALDQRSVDPATSLAESWRILRPGGMLLLRVSAHSWLEGEHDEAFNTARRFARQGLVELVRAAGFRVARLSYANALLATPVAALRLSQRWGWTRLSETHYSARWANQIMTGALRIESRILAKANLPVGLSLYLVAYRNAGDEPESASRHDR